MNDWQGYLLDTNIFIAYLRHQSVITMKGKRLSENEKKDKQTAAKIDSLYKGAKREFPMPIVVHYELLRGYRSAKDKKEREQKVRSFEKFVRDRCKIFELNRAMWKDAADIYGRLNRSGITTDEGDILVMATARVLKRKVATRNIKDFEPVLGANCELW